MGPGQPQEALEDAVIPTKFHTEINPAGCCAFEVIYLIPVCHINNLVFKLARVTQCKYFPIDWSECSIVAFL